MSRLQKDDPSHSLEYLDLPTDLAPYLNGIYVWRTAETVIDDQIPAYSGQMVVIAQGRGRMQFGSTDLEDAGVASFLAPMGESRRIVVEGPAFVCGLSLNHLGWATLTGLAVDEHQDRFLEPDYVLGERLGDELTALIPRWHAGTLDDAGLAGAMCDVARKALTPLPNRQMAVIQRTVEWLASSIRPDINDLYATLPYSKRQAQRLVARFFGQSPVRLARRFRAIRAAAHMLRPDIPEPIETGIQAAFYDQAHMIKEIRYFTGLTPKGLQQDAGSFADYLLGPDGRTPLDPFAATARTGNAPPRDGDD